MPKCVRCGAKMWEMELNEAGLCRQCVASREDNLAAVRAKNLDVCRLRCAKPNIQRIFDGFIAKYPDALLTGISVQDNGDKLLIYLDGKPMYYATFNPLTNSVDLEKYVQRDPRPSAPPSQPSSSSHGFRDFLFIFCGIVLLAVAIYGFLNSSGSSLPNPTAAPRQTATSRPTASPTATALSSDPLSWCKYYANKYTTNDIRLRSVDITTTDYFGTYLTVDLDIKCDHSNTKLQFAHFNEVIIDICDAMSKHEGFDSIMFSGYDDFVNKYGEVSNINSIIADYSISTLRRINYDYHRTYAYSNPTAFIECADTHFVHQGYNLD